MSWLILWEYEETQAYTHKSITEILKNFLKDVGIKEMLQLLTWVRWIEDLSQSQDEENRFRANLY